MYFAATNGAPQHSRTVSPICNRLDHGSSNNYLKVYVRIKPLDEKIKNSTLSINRNHIIVRAPKTSASFKTRHHSGKNTLPKFKFNKIYDSSVKQENILMLKIQQLHKVSAQLREAYGKTGILKIRQKSSFRRTKTIWKTGNYGRGEQRENN